MTAEVLMQNITEKDPQMNEISKDYYNTHVDESISRLDLDDIFISVKTTKNYHNTRLRLIVDTWFQLARDQVSN